MTAAAMETGKMADVDPGAIEHYDNDTRIYLDSYSGGAAPEGEWGKLRLRRVDAEGNESVREFMATGPWQQR